jgi:hypothetical protein
MLASEFTDYLVAWGTVGLGVTTLLLALATIRLVGHTRASAEIGRAGVEAEVQPILVDVPPSAEAPTDMARDEHHRLEPFFLSFDNGAHKVDAIDPRAVSVTRSGDVLYLSVPLRNVARGLAKLTKATLPDLRGTGEAVIRREIVPVGESTRVDFVARGPEDGPTAIRAFESGEISLAFEYTDVGGGQAFALTADLASTDGGAWYLTRLRHRQVLRRHGSWVLDNIAVSVLGMGFKYERPDSDAARRERLEVRAPLGPRARFSRGPGEDEVARKD